MNLALTVCIIWSRNKRPFRFEKLGENTPIFVTKDTIELIYNNNNNKLKLESPKSLTIKNNKLNLEMFIFTSNNNKQTNFENAKIRLQ